MTLTSIFERININMRSFVKNLSMGNYTGLLEKTSPLPHQINKTGNKLALINCNIFDGIHPELKSNMAILIENERIIDIGHNEQIEIPENVFYIDLKGRTLMPGFIDGHVHQCSPFTYDANIAALRQMPLQVALNNVRTVYSGVTTVCDMGGPQGIISEFTQLADNNLIPGPRLLNCYTLISPIKGKNLGYPAKVRELDPIKSWFLEGQVATRPRNIRALKKACYRIKDKGGTHIKTSYQPYPFSDKKYDFRDSFPVFDDSWMRSILRIGKEIGLVVDIHAPYGIGAEKCVDLAIETGSNIRIQHITFDAEIKDGLINKMQDYGFFIIPTMMVYGDSFRLPEFIAWLDQDPKSYLMPEANRQSRARLQKGIELEPYSGKAVMDQDYVYFRDNFNTVKLNTLKVHEAGIMGFGTDSGGTDTGFFGRLYSEIAYYAELGISSFDILKYLTSVNAMILGLTDRGVIQLGKLADLVCVDGNPFENISILKDVSTVIKGGIFLKHEGKELIGVEWQ